MTAISFENISKIYKYGFKKMTVLTGLTLDVNEGEIFGFLGPNGAGKSTAIKLLLNFIRPNTGRITIKGLVVGKDNFQALIGYLPETPCFYENLTGLETLWFAGRASGMDSKSVKEKAVETLKRLDLEAAGSMRVKTYSKGMKQRLGLAMSLIHDPQIYILDEPMSGLDPMGRRLITDVLFDLHEKGKTVFFSSHILSDVEKLCDRIGILHKGKLLFCGKTGDMTKGDMTKDNMIRDRGDLEDRFVNLINEHEGAKNV